MKKIILAAFITLGVLPLAAQTPDWKVGLFHFFDNTEFAGSSYINDQTMAGIRFTPQVGLKFGQTQRVWVGVDAFRNYGSSVFLDDITPTASYEYQSEGFRFQMGRFAKGHSLDAFSRAFFQDSILFFRPNIDGFMLNWQGKDFCAMAYLDWTGKQDSTVHEAFFIGGSVCYRPSVFVAEMQLLMFHHAGSLLDPGVRDNLMAHPAIGFDLGKKTLLDDFQVSLGWLGGIERNRSQSSGFEVRNGALLEIDARYRKLGLKSSSYWGEGLMVDYANMGSELYWGDPLYCGKTYHRVDLSYDFLRSRVVRARLNMSNHFSEGRYYTEQSLTVQVDLDRGKLSHGKK
jgi:hypothetical protein